MFALACGLGLALAVTACGFGGNKSQPVETFSVQTFHHGEFDLADKVGSPVVINFWFPSCPPCVAEMPHLQQAFETYHPRGVEFLGVQQLAWDTPQDGIDFLEELGITYPNAPDESAKIHLQHQVLVHPTTIFLDAGHNISRSWSGLISGERLDEEIRKILP